MADVEALISSRSFHKMYYLESKEITKPKKLSTTVSSDKLSHFMSWTAATREVYMQLLIPMLPGPGAAGEGRRGWKQSLTLLLAGKPKAQRHRGGYREGRSADGWLQSHHSHYSHSGLSWSKDIWRKICRIKKTTKTYWSKTGQIPPVSRINEVVRCKHCTATDHGREHSAPVRTPGFGSKLHAPEQHLSIPHNLRRETLICRQTVQSNSLGAYHCQASPSLHWF